MGYYDLIDSWYGDFIIGSTLRKKLSEMGITEEQLYEMIDAKLDPIIWKVKKEFRKTEEFKAKEKHEAILKQYNQVKQEFERLYGSGEYDYCYDVFGNLKNKYYLQTLTESYERRQKAKSSSSYYSNSNSNYSNFNNYDWSSYLNTSSSNYSDEEKKMLKKIYRVAAKNFHPDISGDDGTMMKFLTKLKEQWKI